MIKKENAKFARKFSTPHTFMYTGVKESIDNILDPKYVLSYKCYIARVAARAILLFDFSYSRYGSKL